MRGLITLVVLSSAVSLASASAGLTSKAWYGFHIKPETSGFALNPVVESVTIDKVKPGSAAAAQKIRVGDQIIEAEGKTIPGARALGLLFLLKKQPGDWMHLRLKRPSGESYAVAVQGMKKPE